MKTAYFPGCSLHAMAREYDTSTRLVCDALGVNLTEVDDWNCCGATAAHTIDYQLTMGLNRRNLSRVVSMGFDRVTTPCAGCFSRLKSASAELLRAGGSMSGNGRGNPKVFHLLQFLVEEVGLDRIGAAAKISLKGLKTAAYYGCLITRPNRITRFDDPEQPVSLDHVLDSIGVKTVSWSHKAECCGGGFAASDANIVADLTRQVVDAARYAGAEALVVACPMCQMNLDTRQNLTDGRERPLPIIYFTQLMALAYGYSVRRVQLKRLLINPLPLLRNKGIV